jgi:hypothetical protein
MVPELYEGSVRQLPQPAGTCIAEYPKMRAAGFSEMLVSVNVNTVAAVKTLCLFNCWVMHPVARVSPIL